MDASELARMQEAINELLPSKCNLLTPTYTPDGQGGLITVWGTASTNIKCRLDPIFGREQVIAEAIQPRHIYQLTLPYGTTITNDYRVEIGSSTYAVTSVDVNQSWALNVRARVEAV